MEQSHKRKQTIKRLLVCVLLALAGWAVYAQSTSSVVRALATHANTSVQLLVLTKPAMFVTYNPAQKKVSVRQLAEKKAPANYKQRAEQLLKKEGLSPRNVKFLQPKQTAQHDFWEASKHALSSWRYNPLLALRFVYDYICALHDKRTNISVAEFLLYAMDLSKLEVTDFIVQTAPKKAAARRQDDLPPVVKDRAPLAVKNRPIVVEILNGSGKRGAALELTQYLREQNQKGLLRVDVLQYDNYPGGNVEKTHIINYSGQLMQVKQLSTAIGCQQEVLSEPRGNAICDTRIIIGKDFQMPL